MLSAHQQPDHMTIRRVRKHPARALARTIIGILRLCAEVDSFTAGLVPLDAAKPRAQASHGRSRGPRQLEAEVERALSEAERVDAEEHRWDGAWQAFLVPNTLRGREQRLT